MDDLLEALDDIRGILATASIADEEYERLHNAVDDCESLVRDFYAVLHA